MIRAETAMNASGRYSLKEDYKSQGKNVYKIKYYLETSFKRNQNIRNTDIFFQK